MQAGLAAAVGQGMGVGRFGRGGGGVVGAGIAAEVVGNAGQRGDVAGGGGVGTGPVRSRGRGWDGERGGKRGAGPFVGAAPGGGMLLAGTACDLLRTFAIPQTLEGQPVICWERRLIRRMCVWR